MLNVLIETHGTPCAIAKLSKQSYFFGLVLATVDTAEVFHASRRCWILQYNQHIA